MKNSCFNLHKQNNEMPQMSALDTYGELEEIIEDDIDYEKLIPINRVLPERSEISSESEDDDQISQEMAKYNKKLKEDALRFTAPTLNNYGRPPASQNPLEPSDLHQRFRPVCNITPEKKDKLPEPDHNRDQISALNCANFQQLFKGQPIPVSSNSHSGGYGRPSTSMLQKQTSSKANISTSFGREEPLTARNNSYEAQPVGRHTGSYGVPLNLTTSSDQFWFQSKKQTQDKLTKVTRDVDITKLSTESLALLNFSHNRFASKQNGDHKFFDSILGQEQTVQPNERNSSKITKQSAGCSLQVIGTSSDVYKPISDLEPVFATAAFNHVEENLPFSSSDAVSVSARSKVLDALLARAKPPVVALDKKWVVSDNFQDNIDWNGMTEINWSLTGPNKVVEDHNLGETTSVPEAIPNQKSLEINWNLDLEKKPKNTAAEDKQPKELLFFFDLNLDSTSSNDFEKTQPQQQSDSTQPRSYSSLTHMPEQNSGVAEAAIMEHKAKETETFINLSKEINKCHVEGSHTNNGSSSCNGCAGMANDVDKQQMQQQFKPLTEDSDKKQKILYMAAAISMAAMAAPEGILRLSKLQKIVNSVFGGNAKPELYGHKDWCSFVNQNCRKNIKVIFKNQHEAFLICHITDEENSSYDSNN